MTLHVPFDHASLVVRQALERGGLCRQDAEAGGRKGHGLVPIPALVARAAQSGSGRIAIIHDTGVSVAVEGPLSETILALAGRSPYSGGIVSTGCDKALGNVDAAVPSPIGVLPAPRR